MYKGYYIYGLVLARSGSKRLKDKNIEIINGIHLMGYTINEANRSMYLDEIVLSTDSKLYSKIGLDYGAKVPFLRPSNLAKDTTTSEEAVRHFVSSIDVKPKTLVVLLQPTQPLRKFEHIDLAIEKLVDNNYSSIMTVHKCKYSDDKLLRHLVDGKLVKNSMSVVREDYYKVNGVVYVSKVEECFKSSFVYNNISTPLIIDEKFTLDIDTYEDLKTFKNTQWRKSESCSTYVSQNTIA